MSRFSERVSQGLCGRCGAKPVMGCSICDDCCEHVKNQKNSKNDRGLCKDCPNPVKEGYTRCAECLDKRRLRRIKRSQLGVCRECNHPAGKGHVYCDECRIKMRDKSRAKSRDRFAEKHLGDVSRWPELQRLLDQQDGKCAYSGLPITVGVDAHLDHIIPKARGGKDELANYQWVLRSVNLMKGKMLESEFLSLCRQIVEHKE